MKRLVFIAIVLMTAFSLLAACNLFGGTQIPKDINAISTLAQQTVIARQTQSAFETLVVQLTQAIQPTLATPQVTVVLPTSTPQVPASDTPVPPTPTFPTSTVQTFCNKVGFVDDVTIKDGTNFLPEETFTKIWRLKNTGTCDWQADYSLVFVNGNAMNGSAATPINTIVKPGQTIDIAVRLAAPRETGAHTGNWMLRTNSGAAFGVGSKATDPFWVKVEVINQVTIKDVNTTFDFTRNFCAADWRNAGGALPCPAAAADTKNGSVFRMFNPVMEIGNSDDEAGLYLAPNDGAGGVISGVFPAYKVKAGDHFKAQVACADKAEGCDVTFQFGYRQANGAIQALGTWVEKYDANTQPVDIDLVGLVDQTLQFVLIVTNNGSSQGDVAVWLAPRITH